jgi:uncharacterized membrane protein YphA (DoxX/SURF4 family)
MSRAQQVLLVVLRTVIGWHFLYEGSSDSATACLRADESTKQKARLAV